MHAVLAPIATMLLVLAAAGIVYTVASGVVLRRFFARALAVPARRSDAVTLLKPLFGGEPRLRDNLASFLRQDHAGPIQLLCGVHDAADPAVASVADLRARHPAARIDLVVDASAHGASGKMSNLVNMDRHAAHEMLVLSDSDMVATPDYLARILAALDADGVGAGVGAVTCVYRGRGDAGFWSRLGAAGLSYQTLPGAVFGVASGLATPCMGSTIAMTRETLDRIGGFARFADTLADDYAIGQAAQALGLRVVVPPMLVTHASAEASFGALWRHELRWGATVRSLVPAAYVGSVIGLPLPLALLGMPVWPMPGGILVLLAFVARLFVARGVDRASGERTAPVWMLPIRDCLTFGVFVATFFVRSVDWRGTRLRMEEDGRVSAAMEQRS